MRIAE